MRNQMLVRAGFVLLVMCFTTSAYGQATWYVDDDAPFSGDGTNWATAFKHLQDALAVAIPGDEIRVAAGTYKPDEDEAGNVTPGDREATFQLVNAVSLKGGYAGLANPDEPDDRNIELYETVLSGDLAGNDRPGCVDYEGNSYHVITVSETDDTTVLDGFTVTAGDANGAIPKRKTCQDEFLDITSGSGERRAFLRCSRGGGGGRSRRLTFLSLTGWSTIAVDAAHGFRHPNDSFDPEWVREPPWLGIESAMERTVRYRKEVKHSTEAYPCGAVPVPNPLFEP